MAMSVARETPSDLTPSGDLHWSMSATFRHAPKPFRYNMPRIIDVLAAVHVVSGLPVNELLSRRKPHEIAQWRLVLYYVCAAHTGRGLNEIAKRLNGRDHTTIMSGIRKVRENIEVYGALIQKVERHMGLRG